MINLTQFTKEQRFALVATALVDAWEKLRQELNGPATAEFNTDTMILNIDNQGCFVNVLRQNYLTWYTFSFTFNKDNKLAFAVTPYVRNNPQFNEVTRSIFTAHSDFEKLASDLPSDYLAPFVNNILRIFSEDNTWSRTFSHFLSVGVQSLPTAKQVAKRKHADKVDARKELRTTFLRISDFYKSLLRHSMLGTKSYTVETPKGNLDITASGLCYQVLTESGQFYTFNMYQAVGVKDQYSYSLTNDNGSLGSFTDLGMFYEDADRLSGLLPREDMLDFVSEFETLITKLGLWSAYTSLGYVK
jgi:hypothetical protein